MYDVKYPFIYCELIWTKRLKDCLFIFSAVFNSAYTTY